MNIRKYAAHALLFILTWFAGCFASVQAQRTVQAEGYIIDSLTNEAIPGVAVYLKGTSLGTATGEDGYFSFKVQSDSVLLVASVIGYEDGLQTLQASVANRLVIRLNPLVYQLDDVIIKPRKERYSRKDNPAVEFIEQAIALRNRNSPRNRDYYSFETYEQKLLAKNDFDEEKARRNWVYKQVDFIFDYIDTSAISGKTILPLFNEEIIASTYYRKSPHAEKQVVHGHKRDGLIDILPEDGMTQLVEEIFKEVDLFQDNIPLFLNRFVSPLSSIGPYFYKYYLLDTVTVGGEACLVMGFVHFNSESFAFTGHLFITLDSTFFVRKAVLNVPKDINLNFVGHMTVEQHFDRTPDQTRLMTKNDVTVEFQLADRDKGFYARRICLCRNHSFEPPDAELFRENAPVVESEEARRQPEIFWRERRFRDEGIRETSVEQMMARLRSVPAFYWLEATAGALINGYVQTARENSKFEFGPANTFISGNALEGMRLRAGGTTTRNLSRHLFADGYLAYGLADRKFKYDALLEYSFNRKKSFRKEYPFHYLRAEYRYDINQIGQHYLYTNADNLFMMLKRRNNNLITYMRTAELGYYREHYNGWGYGLTARHLTEWATPDVPFSRILPGGAVTPLSRYASAQLEGKLRWAPNEKFYQSRNYRYPITLDAPVITLSHVAARKGFLGSDHTYNRTDLGVRKRFWFSPFGYLDLYAQAGKVWNKVPYPLLLIPNANLSYSIEAESYTLMDPMEFINDQYLSWETTYFMNGALFNRLPLIKYLKLREVFAFRGWYGSLSDRNNPALDPDGLYLFPPNTFLMNRGPYMEASAGIENLFKLLRVDYVWRLSYKDHPRTPARGLRIKMVFSF
ncbi:MAG: DUF5686 and carboxypeptidase regulatory-like domain-containing protein [Tannerella sp.]|jgi:hypothetical protein|nr:DUF5686 and carboxypeptidase regulatory-like domain-containing protein [Tannerella sp.]